MTDIETTAEPAGEPTSTPDIRAAPDIDAVIDRWFNDHIAGSPVARSVDAYNHLHAVLGHLGRAIAATLKQEI